MLLVAIVFVYHIIMSLKYMLSFDQFLNLNANVVLFFSGRWLLHLLLPYDETWNHILISNLQFGSRNDCITLFVNSAFEYVILVLNSSDLGSVKIYSPMSKYC